MKPSSGENWKTVFLLLSGFLFLFSLASFAEVRSENIQTVEGMVSYIDKTSITITFDQDRVEGSAKEMSLKRHNRIRFVNGLRWEDIKVNDLLAIQYLDKIDRKENVAAEGALEASERIVEREIVQIAFKEEKTSTLTS